MVWHSPSVSLRLSEMQLTCFLDYAYFWQGFYRADYHRHRLGEQARLFNS